MIQKLIWLRSLGVRLHITDEYFIVIHLTDNLQGVEHQAVGHNQSLFDIRMTLHGFNIFLLGLFLT